jgi:broad specificity phosphatase PhoE
MKLILVRHGEVEESYKGCYNGHIDIGLSKKGLVDAQNLKNKLKRFSFDGVYCSDLIRTKDTLKAFIDTKDVTYHEDLREKSWGKCEGMSYDDIVKSYNIEYKDFTSWVDALGGEGIKEFQKRVNGIIFQHILKQNKECVLVVTHGGVIKSFISQVRGICLEDAFGIDIPYASFIVYDSKTKVLEYD